MACAVTAGATHGDAGAGALASSHALHGQHGAGAPEASTPGSHQEPRGQHEHGELHCPAATTCATVGIAGVVTELPAAMLVATTQIAALNSARPASISGAPEPPPPRA